MPEVELAGHMVFTFLIFEGPSWLLSVKVSPIYIPIQTKKKSGSKALHRYCVFISCSS